MEEKFLKEVNLFIFAPVNTFVFLDNDKIQMQVPDAYLKLRQSIADELNKDNYQPAPSEAGVRWSLEESESTKRAKGVFQPTGKDNSFIMAEILNSEGENRFETEIPGVEFQDVFLYFHIFGISTLSVKAVINLPDGFDVKRLEEISERSNDLFKDKFERICYQLACYYSRKMQSKELDLPISFLPDIGNFSEAEIRSNSIPWTHRIYHIHDPKLFEMENPGNPFRFLLTPSRQLDVKDLSIYDNRYIYFGWGHSIILTREHDQVFSQTDTSAENYIRLVEIAQANWQCLDLLSEIINRGKGFYREGESRLRARDLDQQIDRIQKFNWHIREILEQFTELKITFDTEKRSLLEELHSRWHTNELKINASNGLDSLEQFLSSLYDKKKEKSDETLNNVLFILTVLAMMEILNAVFDALPEDSAIKRIGQLAYIGICAGILFIGSVIYLKLRG